MNVLVTGADGFVAQSLIPMLFDNKHRLCLIGKDKDLINRLYGVSVNNHSYISLEQPRLKAIIEMFQPEVIVHLAAYSSPSDEYHDVQKMFSANLFFLCRILESLKNSTLKLFIYTGSSTEFSKGDNNYDPAYFYSATKTAGRYILKYYSDVYNFKNISIIPYNIYGGGDTRRKVLDLIYESTLSEKPINLTKGEQILDFIHVEDVCKLYISVIDKHKKIPDNSILHAGTGYGNTLIEIAKLIEAQCGRKANINWGRIDYRKKDTMYSVASISETTNISGWKPNITLKEGIKRYILEKEKYQIS